ncbi:MAG: 2-oxo acid dehydrogenase subunit E2 [Chloroflexi bacterium]|nr:2-oxo acid dehydrogenase subunit E2 [Chloroflexota bacterium]
MATKVIMPQMGESVVEGTVGKWLKQEGDTVEEYEPLLEVETDKVTSEVTAPARGTILKIYVGEGRTVDAGTVLALIGQPGEDVPDAPAAEPVHEQPALVGGTDSVEVAEQIPESCAEDPAPAPVEAAPLPAPHFQRNGEDGAQPHVTPLVARIAAEHNVDVSRVQGSGRGGRVTKKDILAYLEQREAGEVAAVAEPDLPPWERPGSGDLFKPTDDLYKTPQAAPAPPAVEARPAAPGDHVHKAPPAPGQPGELVPHSTMRRRIAEHMVHSKLHTAPHVTTVFEADLHAVVAHRSAHKDDFARRGVNLTFTAYFVAATAEALRRHPGVNSQWTDDGILLKPEINIGMAVALDEGLIVPVLKRVDELSLAGIARQVNDLAQRARSSALKPDEVTGGTFTITNHGVAGSLFATPIINQPQTGILGVGAIQKRVVVLDNDAIAVRPMVYLSFTFDHRVLDGASADWFVAEIVTLLESWA